MKKKFNILGALVCAVVLGFAGCDTVRSILDNWTKALQEALGLNRTHTLIAESEPVALDDGAMYTFQAINNSNYSDENLGKYIYYTASGTAVADSLPSSSGLDAYYWEVEKTSGSTYTFRLKNTSSGNVMYMANTYNSGQMDLTSSVSDAAEMQMWKWTNGSGVEVNIIALTNKVAEKDYNGRGTKSEDEIAQEAAGGEPVNKNDPIDPGETAAYNAYLYPVGESVLTNVHWWGAATNEELTNVLAVTYDKVE